ncbi:MAG: adenosylmethionine--8-amino-7-oxononanoate transaminase [Desulfovibrionaceae bacterium]|nr:adenosylmethionine--8-amino-7-oxononanoate transaminase [Desulfovibrionaceae bacterium]
MRPDNTLCLCIAGTDTDAGKTVVTAALARAAMAAGLRTLVIKPVQTGSVPDAQNKPQAPDLAVCREAAPGADTRALFLFAAACSPHLAARIEDRPLAARELAEEVTRTVREWIAPGPCRNLVLLEGAGGLLTPISESETLGDLFALLNWPVLLVAANRLGAVNHALLSLEALRSRDLACPGFIMAEGQEARSELERTIRRDNPLIIAGLGKKPCLAELPYMPGLNAPCSSERQTAWDQAARSLAPVLEALEWRGGAPIQPDNFDNADLLRFDREHLWHPYTSALRPLRVWEATGSHGSRIRLRDGRELIDGMASWWCAIHGYRHPALMRALQTQAETLPHVMFGGLTHAPAVRLGQRLLDMVPATLEHVFFADSGSVAVEAALKMALQYWQATGDTRRTRILTVRGGYHGDTLGAMSVCDPENGMHALFSGILPRQIFAPRPECRFDAPYDPASERAFAEVLAAHADSVAAVILEPIVQGAGGMWFYHPDFLRAVHGLCKQHGCLLILDEIATGFGRTGRLFACEHAEVEPDILCLGKGLSGGVLTLAATLATREVAEGISRDGGVFMHGPTFMANPLACAVAEASLELIAGGTWQADVARLETGLRQGLAPCARQPDVADVRVLGAIGVVEMRRAVNMERLQSFFVDQGVWIRPFGKLIYLMPPYVATDDDIAALCTAVYRALDQGMWR